jgi:hypothetical protein
MCHCKDCQRRTGSLFSVAAFYDRAAIIIQNDISQTFKRNSASGMPVTFHFCSRCGSNVFWEPERMPNLIGIAIGAFEDPNFPAPEQSVWMKDKHIWLQLPHSICAFDVNPPARSTDPAGS